MSFPLAQRKQLVALSLAATTTIVSALPISALPTPPIPIQIASTSNPYQAAQQQLQRMTGEYWQEFFALYKTLERIARANELDQRPWRVGVIPTYEINAFATDINLVVGYRGFLDQLAGDEAAIAWLMGHEMAHNQLRHSATKMYHSEALKAKLEAEADAELQNIVQAQKKELQNQNLFKKIFPSVIAKGCNFIPALCRNRVFQGTIAGSVLLLNSALQPDPQKVAAKKQAIIAEKQRQYDSGILNYSQEKELEADRQGYIYMATAGYDPQGAIRTLEVLARTPGAEFDTTHPNTPSRIAAMRKLIQDYPAASLAAKGAAKLRATQPLSIHTQFVPYSLQVSENKSVELPTIRVNSQFGR